MSDNRVNIVNRRFTGISINSGVVFGKVCMYSSQRHRTVSQYSLSTQQAVDQELQRFDEAIVLCSHELNRIASEVAKNIGKAEAEIFLTQKHIMNDPKLIESIKEAVSVGRKNAEWAISDILNSYEEQFTKIDNEYLRERSSDIGEVRRRLLNKLTDKKSGFVCKGHANCTKGRDRVIVAEELTPDMVANMDLDKVLGFVTERGGITSHAAIMARSIGVPAISGVIDLLDSVNCGDTILIDGDNGQVFINPEESLTAPYLSVEKAQAENVCAVDTPRGMKVLANASSMEDVKVAEFVRADGIGLFRTEILFMKNKHLLSVEEQFLYYKNVMDQMGDKPVTFRLLDAGGDKQLPFLKMEQELNPFLGWRGSRFLLGNPEILRDQLTALLMLSKSAKMKIMYPMVVDQKQARQLVSFARDVMAGIECKPENVSLGAMFEIPSAFLQAKEILTEFDFGSIGSNDLIQYLFAIDRGNALVAGEYDPEHPVLWNLLRQLADTAVSLHKPLSLCGEMAGREGISTKLVATGIKSLSIAPRLIPRVRSELARYAGVI